MLPKVFNIQLTSKCNLNCYFCIKTNAEYKKIDLDLETFKKYVDEILKAGIKIIDLCPTVGDILNIPNINEYFDYLDNSEVEYYFFFTSLTSEFSDDLFKRKKLKLYISLYGTNRELFEKTTNSKRYDILKKNLLKIKDLTNVCLLLRTKGEHDMFFKVFLRITKFYRILDDYEMHNINKKNNNINSDCLFKLTDNGVVPNGDIVLCNWVDSTHKDIIGNIWNLKETYKDDLMKKSFDICKGCDYYEKITEQRKKEFFLVDFGLLNE